MATDPGKTGDGPGTLYVVATPIGNLEDLSDRGRRVLGEVQVIAAEDTRVTRRLLDHYGIQTPLVSVHDHNERQRVSGLIQRLNDGDSVALVSDAGTPLISDPGHVLVTAAIAGAVPVVPVPGASAVIAALSSCGLAVNRFSFDGFLPSKHAARVSFLESIRNEPRATVVFESPRRVHDALKDIAAVLGDTREVVVAAELTKRFERFYRGTAGALVAADTPPEAERRGEFVIVIAPGAEEVQSVDDGTLGEMIDAMPVRQAVALVARLTGDSRNALYERALALKNQRDS